MKQIEQSNNMNNLLKILKLYNLKKELEDVDNDISNYMSCIEMINDRNKTSREYRELLIELIKEQEKIQDMYTVPKTHIGILDINNLKSVGIDTEDLIKRGILIRLNK